MMRSAREDLLQSCDELRALCAGPVVPGSSATFDEVCVITRRIGELSRSPEIAASALDVRFKAEDLFHRTHQMSESILRLMLEDRLQRLDALVRTRTGTPRDRRAPGQHGRRASDRPGNGPG
jgi:hypothetical protein